MALILQNISKQYNKKTALDQINLAITPGIFGLIGPNGAGKTSLINILATISSPTNGNIYFHDTDLLRNPEKIRPTLGYLPQNFGFYPNMTAVQFLDYLLLFYRASSPTLRKKQIEQVLAAVGLSEVKNQKLKSYSGGMIRRLGIAQAFLNDPKLLIVDEPTAGLDPEERIRFRQLLKGLIQNDSERIVIISSHIINDISQLANQIAILKTGNLLFSGTPAKFIELNQKKIWEVEVDSSEAVVLQSKYHILNTFASAKGIRCHVFTDQPPTDSKPVHPDLEGAYFAFMHGEVA